MLKFLNFKIINQVIFSVIVVFGVFYLIGINDLTVKGFNYRELLEKNNQLVKENEDFELSIASLSSYNDINSRIKDLKMVVANNIDYIDAGAIVVAKK